MPDSPSTAVAKHSVSEIVESLTLEEKVLLVEGVDSWNTNGVDRLGVRRLFVTDGPHGLRKVRADAGGFGLSDNEPSTAFPTAVTVASSWNVDNAFRMGKAIARECVDAGVDVLLAPGVNIKRSPLCGRNFEYFSEDPLVSGSFGSAFVRGVEGEGVATSVKHFAANSNENFRFVGDSVVDERALREIYLRAFEQTVKTARPATVMCAYNRLNGTFASDNKGLLTDILRDEWGFDGLVMTDWGATHDRVAGVRAGCDLDMPGQIAHNRQSIVNAVADGSLPMEDLDRSVRRVLELGQRTESPIAGGRYDADEHARLSGEIAADGAVLLKNDGVLPLDPHGTRLVVVGEMFEKMRFQGAGSSLINPPGVVTPKDAFDARAVSYEYHQGYRALQIGRDERLEDDAIGAVRRSDTVLFFGGLTDFEESEGFDRPSMALGDNQTRLLQRLIGTGARVVLVLFAGAAVELPFADGLQAILNMNLPGMHGGEAAAALLFGELSPSGKLAESWPLSAEDSSARDDFDRGITARYYESIYVGYRFYDKAGTRLRFPFGFGLSYTAFEYRNLVVTERDGRVIATAEIANVGHRDASEVVQLYVRNNEGSVFKAEKELRAFTKVFVPAGGVVPVELDFAVSDLSYWDVAEHGWVLENGRYDICLAASAADVRLSAPLEVVSGTASRSPYSPDVDREYASPPRTVPAAFSGLVGKPILPEQPPRRLSMESRITDGRRTLLGRILYSSIIRTVTREYSQALAMPDSLERDTRVKNTHFVVKMMPFSSLRSMAMSSAGQFPFHVAVGLELISEGHLLRGLRALSGRPSASIDHEAGSTKR